MFSIIDILDMRRYRNEALYNKCTIIRCESTHEFENTYGNIPEEQCEFDEAYNDIVSSKGDGLETYVIGKTLWAHSNEGYKHTTLKVLLAIYVLSAHCEDRYKKITKLGFWNKRLGEITLLSVSDISPKTLETVNYNFFGFVKKGENWEESEGTNKSILYEAVTYFKEWPQYKDKLRAFKYDVASINCICKFENETKYPIIKETNLYPAPHTVYGGSDYDKLTINYITDIHLEYHIDDTKPVKSQIHKLVKQLICPTADYMRH